MMKIVAGIGTAALALVIVSKTVRAEVSVGDGVTIQAICKARALVEAQIASVVDRGGKYDEANALYEVAVMQGDCVTLPAAHPATVAEIGAVSPDITDEDGDVVRMTAIRVNANVPVWTVVFEIIKKGGQS